MSFQCHKWSFQVACKLNTGPAMWLGTLYQTLRICCLKILTCKPLYNYLKKRLEREEKLLAEKLHPPSWISQCWAWRYARGALVTSFRVGWLSEIVGYSIMADYFNNTDCDLPTVKRRDWTRNEHYESLWIIVEFKSRKFRKFCVALSFTLVDLKFLVQQTFSLTM